MLKGRYYIYFLTVCRKYFIGLTFWLVCCGFQNISSTDNYILLCWKENISYKWKIWSPKFKLKFKATSRTVMLETLGWLSNGKS